VQLLLGVAQTLSMRREALDRASRIAERAVNALPAGAEWDVLRGVALNSHGTLEAQRGAYAEAIAPLTRALDFYPDSQATLFALGHVHEQLGRADEAIALYVRSLAVFGGEDLRAQDPLRTLYEKRHGSLDGLEPMLDRAREASRHHVAIASRRDERPAPAWALADFEGDSVTSSTHAGKVAVYNFWGSWCGPCRRELPYFAAMVQRFKDRDVAFLGMNWERVADPAERVRLARAFLAEQGLEFPVALDHDQSVGRSFGVSAYPTVFVVDRSGRIRFRNVGFTPRIDEIMTAQIESLLAE
jgi:thiol-disulfide isomerase/thioredoxin